MNHLCTFTEMEEEVINLREEVVFPGDHIYTIEPNVNHDNMQPLEDPSEGNVQCSRNEQILSAGTPEYTYWQRNVTLRLIQEYRENHKKVGVSIRSFKKLFEMIAATLNKTFGLNLTGVQVNNKFKTLERSYKNVIDNNNKTGRGRKFFDYEREMDDIFRKVTKINPEVLLSESNVVKIPSSLQGTSESSGSLLENKSRNDVNTSDPANADIENHKDLNTIMKSSNQPVRKSRNKKTRRDVLELIRQDRLEYQKKQISTASERLAIESEKLKERKRRNALLEERNQLLKEYLQRHVET